LTGSGKSFLRRRDFKEGDKERLLDGLGGVAAVQQTPQILLLDPILRIFNTKLQNQSIKWQIWANQLLAVKEVDSLLHVARCAPARINLSPGPLRLG
jgi:hypothetical protein